MQLDKVMIIKYINDKIDDHRQQKLHRNCDLVTTFQDDRTQTLQLQNKFTKELVGNPVTILYFSEERIAELKQAKRDLRENYLM